MLIVLGCAVLVLAVGMVVLFAMFGELSARVGEGDAVPRSTTVRPLKNARLGRVPGSWPPAIDHPGAAEFTVLVLSSACTSCADIAAQLIDDPGHTDWDSMGIAISTSDREVGEDFVARHGLGELPHYVDVGGDWVSTEFDVRMSPSALVFRDGQLAAAYIFHDVAALRATVARATATVGHGPEKEDAWTE